MTDETDDVRPPIATQDLELSPETRDYIYWRGLGLTRAQAYRRSHPTVTPAQANHRGRVLESKPVVRDAIAQILEENRVRYNIDRDAVVEGLMEAINVAREQSDARSMISGWTEVGRITGVEAPKQAQQPTEQLQSPDQLASASDEDLLRLLNRSRQLLNAQKETVDAEYTEVKPEPKSQTGDSNGSDTA